MVYSMFDMSVMNKHSVLTFFTSKILLGDSLTISLSSLNMVVCRNTSGKYQIIWRIHSYKQKLENIFFKLIILANDENKIMASVPIKILNYGKCVNLFLEIMANVSLFYA